MAVAKDVQSTKKLLTANELWQVSETSKNLELVRGEIVEMTPPGGTHGKIALRLGRLLQDFVDTHNLGEVMVETGFRLATQPDTVRGPDISFLAADKIPSTGLPDGYIDGAPNLAVEIVSPNDAATEIQDKVEDCLTSGTQLVWVIYPQQRIIIVYHPDGTARTLHENDTLSGEEVLSGFSCRVRDIFG